MIRLDYSISSPEERLKIVEQYLQENPNPSERYLEILADYLVLCMERKEKKEKRILTANRMVTINRRECSYDSLAAQFENGEDGVYNLMADESPSAIFRPKVSITKKDIAAIPELQQLRSAIEKLEEMEMTAYGRDLFVIKHTLIDLRKDQYLIKEAYTVPLGILPTLSASHGKITLEDRTHRFDAKGHPIPEGFSLLDWKTCSKILCNYSLLKEEGYGKFDNDIFYVMDAFDDLCTIAFKDLPIYDKIIELKIDGLSNIQIQKAIIAEFGVKYSIEYISSLWRNKIPKLIASVAEDQFLDYYYREIERGKYKKCSRCGEIKLAHSKYFSKNKSNRDGFYSICKKCRNSKGKKK